MATFPDLIVIIGHYIIFFFRSFTLKLCKTINENTFIKISSRAESEHKTVCIDFKISFLTDVEISHEYAILQILIASKIYPKIDISFRYGDLF